MAKDKLTDYDSTASGNLDVGGISVAEGMLPSGVNNAIRELMSHQADAFGAGTPLYVDQTNNRLGVGTSSPATALTVASEGKLRLYRADNARYSDIYNDSNFLNIETSNDPIKIAGQTYIRFDTDGSEAGRWDASGNLLVGTTDTTPFNNSAGTSADFGFVVNKAGGYTSLASYNTTPLYINRTSSDGDIVNFRKNGSAVGSIGAWSSGLLVGTGDVGLAFVDGTPERIQPRKADDQTSADALIDLGHTSNRFKDLYLSGGVYLGGTGSANHLDDYEEGTWTGTLIGATTAGNSPTTTGYYTKVGNEVTVWIQFNNADITGAVGLIRLNGLPFTVTSAVTPLGSIANTRGPNAQASAYFQGGTNGVYQVDYASAAISWVSTGAGTYVFMTGTYRT